MSMEARPSPCSHSAYASIWFCTSFKFEVNIWETAYAVTHMLQLAGQLAPAELTRLESNSSSSPEQLQWCSLPPKGWLASGSIYKKITCGLHISNDGRLCS